MAMQIYNYGLDALAEWETAAYQWRAFSQLTFLKDAGTIEDAVAAGTEIDSLDDYAPVDVTGAVRTIDEASDRIEYRCDNPEWSGLGAGETINAILLTKALAGPDVGYPIGMWVISPGVDSDTANPLVFDLAGGMVAYINQAT